MDDRWDLALFLLGVLGFLLGMGLSLFLLLLAGFALIAGDQADAPPLLWTAAAMAALGLAGIPAMILGMRGQRVAAAYAPRRYWIIGLIAFPIAIALGHLAFGLKIAPVVIGPMAHFLAASAPVVVASTLVLASAPGLSLRRIWGHFLSGLWLVPPVAFAVEIMALIPIGLLILLGLRTTPTGQELLSTLERLQFADPAELEHLLEQVLLQPWILVLLLLFVTLLVPLVEEALKTIVIWPLLRRGLSPLHAFIGGALGGAGYALFESLFLPQPGGLWIATMLGRSGTSLVHALATGLTCWGIAEAFRARKPGRLLLAYVAAVVLHGSWNLSALGVGIAASSREELFPANWAPALGFGSAALLIGLSVFSLVTLIRVSRSLAAPADA